MRAVVGNFWELKAYSKGIPTNGVVKKNGRAVMGRGVALQARERWPDLEGLLGTAIAALGNHVYPLGWFGEYPDLVSLFSFPVKHHWARPASLELIERSVAELANKLRGQKTAEGSEIDFMMPLPGTGNGGLEPWMVWPLVERLPDNVTIVVLDVGMLPRAVVL